MILGHIHTGRQTDTTATRHSFTLSEERLITPHSMEPGVWKAKSVFTWCTFMESIDSISHLHEQAMDSTQSRMNPVHSLIIYFLMPVSILLSDVLVRLGILNTCNHFSSSIPSFSVRIPARSLICNLGEIIWTRHVVCEFWLALWWRLCICSKYISRQLE